MNQPPVDCDLGNCQCDPIAQTRCSGETSRCTLVDDGAGNGNLVPICVVPTGSKSAGEACLRGAGAAGLGMDDCAAGLWCSPFGSETPPASPS